MNSITNNPLEQGVIGIDEVGRGCWAGPLVAGAVLLGEPIPGLKDSKKLSKKRRQSLAAQIQVEALGFGLGWVTPAELDEVGLTGAVKLAMERALEALRKQVPSATAHTIIVDGSFNFLPHEPNAQTLVKADDLVPSVSAASILAKVARDTYMYEQDIRYPSYGFGRHVGYGTAEHLAALKANGICELHRRSFRPIQQYLRA